MDHQSLTENNNLKILQHHMIINKKNKQNISLQNLIDKHNLLKGTYVTNNI